MDRNTIIGLVLIGTIFSVFTIFNQPSAEEQKKRTEGIKKEQALLKEKEQIAEEQKAKSGNQNKKATVAAVNDTTKVDSTSVAKVQPAKKAEVQDSLIFMENAKYKVAFNTRGGMVAAIWLKEYETYADYAKNDGKITPLALFKDGDAVNQLVFEMNGKKVKTGKLPFYVTTQTEKSIVLETEIAPGKIIQNRYTLSDDSYDLNYTVHIKGLGDDVNPKNVGLNWDVAYRKSERLFMEQRRVSTICMNYKEEGFDYLSEVTNDDQEAEDNIEWVAYKQSYFSSFLHPEKPFAKKGSDFEVKTYAEGHEKQWTNLKDFSSTLMLDLSNTDNASMSMNWFFGPNDYSLLSSYDKSYDQILNYGWGLFRWINVYAVEPLFNMLTQSLALSAGLAILLLTLIIKFVLMPIQWKMYVSSAKMRILKPEIDELNKKYPKQEDAMKKQMEMMALYRESGASPLSGCIPMLIQMPILLAVFRFFPSTFDLRQKPFLWAEDLSSYDSIADLGVNIWFYGDHVSLFTLLMAVTTLVYTVLNSGNMQTPQQPGMPNMKIIMYMFPILMIFFFNSYASGLSYYYFISTLISILMMLAIKKFFVDEDKLKAKMAAKKANASTAGPKKKSKFQERLEQMQKMQQEQMKNKKK
jgi:YidC/Oxa1 family membrane protein insertase